MSFQGDPYRTLGVAPGASLNEIKSAYRRLVKQYHPDAAGERALPRFLSIQAAYERLVDGEGRLRPVVGPARGPAPSPAEAWQADPARARASRDAWRARRAAGQTGAGGTGTGTGTRGPGGRRSTSGAGASGSSGGFGWARPGAGSRRPAGDAADGERPQREHHARRGPRKATPGSTTYDEAAELPLDPEWDGGAWYGPSSGTYWTLNPREYADPRKHGPEYQARARRAAQAQRAGLADDPAGTVGDPAPEPSPSTDAAGDAPRWRWTGGDASTTGGGAEWGTGAWRYDEAAARPTPGDRRRTDARADARADSRPAVDAATAPDEAPPDLESLARRFSPHSLLDLGRRRDRRWRLLLALIGWPPIGYAVGTLATQVTACAPAAPTCVESLAVIPVMLQPVVIVALFLVPPAAAVAAFASLVSLAVALPVAAILSVGGAAGGDSASPVLGVIAIVAWFAALVAGAGSAWRAPDEVGAGPPET